MARLTLEPKNLSFDQVESTSREVTYEEVAGHYPGPMSKHPVISVKGHPEVIWVRPDMGIGMVANSMAFAAGSPPSAIAWREVGRTLMRGYLPIVMSRWSNGPLLFTQTSFATLLGSRVVTSGHEKQVAVVQMTILNTGQARRESLWAFVPGQVAAQGVPSFPYNTYDLFDVVGSLPPIEGRGTEAKDRLFRDDSLPIGVYQADNSIPATAFGPVRRFDLELMPGEEKSVVFLVTSSARGLGAEELAALDEIDFASELERRMCDLESLLEIGTQIDVPDPLVNHIYKAQILHAQSQLVQAADRPYRVLAQGFQGVWPWEVMKFTVHWDSIGHHEDVRRCLEYFLEIQGRFPPHGNFESSAGVFGGTIAFEESGWEKDPKSTLYGQLAQLNAGKEGEFPNWMNGTGALLYAFAVHYRYTRDREWLRGIAPSLISAANWIIGERQQTKKTDAAGKKVLHFGLLPIGRAYDTAEEAIRRLAAEGELSGGKMDDRHAPLDTYYPCWTDSYSSQGLTAIAQALADIEHPEGDRLLREARAYREDILAVMRETRSVDPSLPPYPERLYRPPAWAEFATGALAYWDTDFLDPADDAFKQLEGYMKKNWNRGVVGLTGGLEKNGDPHGSNSFYVSFSEDIWHRCWLLRGEVEKALLVFYSMLALGLDRQTLATVERIHLSDPRYAPFFMDTSASARVLGLIRQALLLEAGEVLYLLAGVPRRWLESGKGLKITRLVCTAAQANLRVQSELEKGRIVIQLELLKLRTSELGKVRLRVPHPSRQKMTAVELDGRPWSGFDPEEERVEFTPRLGRTEIVVRY